MTTFTYLSLAPNGGFAYPEALAMYLNVFAMAEGSSGAPRVRALALSSVYNTLTGSLSGGSSVTIALGAFAFFPAFDFTGGSMDMNFAAGSTNADAPNVVIHNSSASSGTYTVTWRSIT